MKKRLGGDHKAEIKTRSDEAAALFEQMTQLICCSEAEAETDRQITLPRLRALFAAVRDFDARFTARKRERKLLEFSDFEHLALRLLRTPEGTPTPLCENIRQDYAAVMVDEYQDTNALQDALYRCLAAPAGDNLFLVGDLKQSIYASGRQSRASSGKSWTAGRCCRAQKPVPARRRAPRERTLCWRWMQTSAPHRR